MKTIKELTEEHNLNRSTLLKAVQSNRVPARQSGDIWLVDEESEAFKQWLTGTGKGRPRNKVVSPL